MLLRRPLDADDTGCSGRRQVATSIVPMLAQGVATNLRPSCGQPPAVIPSTHSRATISTSLGHIATNITSDMNPAAAAHSSTPTRNTRACNGCKSAAYHPHAHNAKHRGIHPLPHRIEANTHATNICPCPSFRKSANTPSVITAGDA